MVDTRYFAERYNNLIKAAHAADSAASLVVDLGISASQIFQVLQSDIEEQEKTIVELQKELEEKNTKIMELQKELEEVKKRFEPIDADTTEN